MGGAPHLEEVCSFTGMTGCLRESSLWRESGLHEEAEETMNEGIACRVKLKLRPGSRMGIPQGIPSR